VEIGLAQIAAILRSVKNIAVVGLSPKPERPSYQVAAYLLQHGYEIVPVNPNHGEILGRKCFASLTEVPMPVQIVNVFRRSNSVPAIVTAAIQKKVPCVWLQTGIRHEAAAASARQHRLILIQHLCILQMHQQLHVQDYL